MVYPRLTSAELRAVRLTRRRWRGLDPDEVYALLRRVADELDLLHRDLRVAQEDADRVKAALLRGQTGNARASDRRWRGGRP
ncbi:DivIVA domain-containing protein [Micromonospora sp. NPDC049559]|uniref:DivIVA domain-containing protein n=1 Tax=Micromonospora sp. NPDC049559 TaxID=3155923 RepID=UPI003431CF25